MKAYDIILDRDAEGNLVQYWTTNECEKIAKAGGNFRPPKIFWWILLILGAYFILYKTYC